MIFGCCFIAPAPEDAVGADEAVILFSGTSSSAKKRD
jgi:hypothetical protein